MRSGDGDDNGGCGAGLAGNRDSSGKGSVAQLLEMVCVEAGCRPGAELRLFANARPYIGGFPCPIVGNNPFVLHLHEDGFVSLAPDTVANATLHQRLGPIGLLSERQPLHLVVKCLHGSNAKLEEPHPRLRQIVWELGGLFERSLWASTRGANARDGQRWPVQDLRRTGCCALVHASSRGDPSYAERAAVLVVGHRQG